MAEPMYRQIAEDLRERIKSGEFEPGSKLPAEDELRARYRASRNTIRDAIASLSNRGLVVAQPGRGTFVVEKITPFIVPLTPVEEWVRADEGGGFVAAVQAQDATARVAVPRVEVRSASDDLARELRIEPDSQVITRHQERFIDGQPSSLQTSFYPMEFAQDGAVGLLQARDIDGGTTKYLVEKLGVQPVGYRDRLTVRPPDVAETAFFRLRETGNVLVVVLRRTVYTNEGKPIRFTVTVYPADRNHFVIDFGDTPSQDEIVREL